MDGGVTLLNLLDSRSNVYGESIGQNCLILLNSA